MGKLSLAIGLFLLGGVSLFAGPKNGTPVHGHATFQSNANEMEIYSRNKTIIHWDSFSIDAGEIVRFCQNSSASAVLNRVIGSEKSLINGLLTSNGYVFLLNQNGILIGKEGVIDTAGFVASSLDLSNDQFLKGGDFLFKGDGKGSVINLGTIHAKGGDVFLIGYHVSNEGTIHADGGVAGLGGGAEVFLAMEGEERLFIRKEIDSSEVGASNDGVIRAAEVEIKARGNPFALAIRHGGEIEATGIAHRSGRVLLVADSGKTEVAGMIQAESGVVHALGTEVHLTEGAAIDVSGRIGGEVLIGGDYRGDNPEISNARATYIDKGAKIRADGHHGDGGKVIVWGDEAAHYYGDISAAALGEVGDGGLVEVSAKSNDYIFKGPVNASSLNGANGKLLLDPPRIRVRFVASNPPFPQGGPNTYKPTAPPSTANLNPNDFTGILAGGTNVLIDSTGAGGTNGNIDFEASFSWNGTGILSATAYRKITVTGGTTLQANNGGGFNFVAQGNGTGNNVGIDISGSLITTSGPITLNGTSTLSAGSNLNGINVAGTLMSSSGPILLTGLSRGGGTGCHGIDVGGTISATGAGTITFNGTGSTSATGNSAGVNLHGPTTSSAGGLITVTGVGGTGGTNNHGVALSPTGNVTSSGGVTLIGTSSNGNNSTGVLVPAGSAALSSGTGAISITGNATGAGTSTHGVHIIGSVTNTGTGSVSITGNTAGNASHGIYFQGNVSSVGGINCVAGTTGAGISDAIVVEGSVSTTSMGPLSMTGTVSGAAGTSDGIDIRLGGRVTSVDGVINLSGTSNGTGNECTGIELQLNGGVQSTGVGAVTLTGMGSGVGTSEARGVKVTSSGGGGPSFVSVNNGNLVINGTGKGTTINNEGFLLGTAGDLGSYVRSTGTGNITINGTGSSTGTTVNSGIHLTQGLAVTSSGSGSITFMGQGGAGNDGYGVFIHNGADVIASGSGLISLTGTAGTGSGNTYGVYLTGAGSSVTSASGAASLIGTGGSGAGGAHNVGVFIESGGTLASTSGIVTVKGTGGNGTSLNHGVELVTTGAVTSPAGLVLNGTSSAGNSSVGVLISNGVTALTSGVGAISITGNSTGTGTGSHAVQVAGAVNSSGTGSVTIVGTTTGTSSRGVLVDGAATGTIAATSGAVSITGTNNSVGGSSNAGIDLTSGAMLTTTGGNVTFSGNGGTGNNGYGVIVQSGSQVNLGGSGIASITGTSGSGSGNNYGVYLTGANSKVMTNSGSLTVSGTSNSGAGGAHNVGAFIENGGTLASTSGVVSIIGVGGNGTTLNHGVELITTGTVTSPGGLVLNGTSSQGTNSRGVLLAAGITAQVAGSGNISITGVSSATAGSPGVEIGGTVTTPGSGTIMIQGTNNGSAATSPGVLVTSGTVSSTSGNITLTGTGNTGAALSQGISLNGASISATGGNIQLTGTGQDTSGSPAGIAVAGGSSLATTGLGTMTLTTLAGNFTDSGVAANTYNTQQGTFSLTSAGAVLFSSGLTSSITTTLGSASLTANGGNILLADSGTVTTGGGTANLTATDHVRLGVVNVTNTGDIFISAGGQVSDNSVALVDLIGNRAYITSGETGNLPTTLNQFQGVTSTSVLGNESITITNSQALNLIAWNIPGNAVQTASNGSIAIATTLGGIIVSNDVVAGGSGMVNLNAPGAITVLEDVSSTSGNLVILGSSVTHVGSGHLTTGGTGVINVTATAGNITMNSGISFTTAGGNATLLASNSALLTQINVGAGNISVTATTGTISNNSGANSPAILIGNQGTLTSALGAGSGTSTSSTAIGTDLTTLIGTVTGGSGGLIIYEQSGLNLGNISAPNGTVDINANGLIQQVAGNPTLAATDALFTTRALNIGTADVKNSVNLLLNASLVAGSLFVDVGANTFGLNGNTDVGINYTVTAGTYNLSGFTVNVGGTSTTPPTAGVNVVTASGVLDDFDLSSVTLAPTGNIIVNLRGGFYSATNPQPANAILINSTNNSISNSLTLTTVNPNLSFSAKDYNLKNTLPISLGAMQNFIVNAAKGANFTPGVVNPKSSPYDNSSLNLGNGSIVNIVNHAPANTFQGWVSIRDSYTTTFEAGPNLLTEYVNTYGDTTIKTSSGAIMTGATGETMRSAGSKLSLESNGNLTIGGTVSNLTIPGALNGILSYTSTAGSITGPALGRASQVKISSVAGGIGTGGQDLTFDTGQLVFTAANDVFLNLNGAVTMAGDSTTGAIDIETSSGGNLTVGNLTIDGLSRMGLTSAGASGTQVVTIAGDILVNQAVTGNNGPIQLTASGGVTHGANGDLTTIGVNAIVVNATSGAINMDPNTIYTTGNGNASLNAHVNIEVSQINVGTGDIFLNSTTGSIVRITGPPTNLIGGRGYALASSGIGASGNILQSTLNQFQGRVALPGDIYLSDTAGGLQLTNWNGGINSAETNSGNIDIQTAAGALTVTNPVVAGNAGTINLDANTGAVALNQTVTSSTGSITITGNTNVTHGASGIVTVSSGIGGTVTETATTGDITMNGASMVVTQGGAANLTAGTNVIVSNVNVLAGDLKIEATGGTITRVGAGVNLIGGRGYCASATGIGISATPIRSTLTDFQANVTGVGPITLQETNGINLTDWNIPGNSVQTTNGLIQVEVQTGNLIITNPVVAGGVGTLNLTATTGAIVNNSGANTPPILTGDQATLTAQTGVGSGLSVDPTAIGTNIGTLIATVGGAGGVVIFEQSALNLGAISLNNGTLDINANDVIQQIAGNPLLQVSNAKFTTRSGTIGKADVRNGGNLTLNGSIVAGNLDINIGGNTLTLGGNSKVGIDYTVVAGAYDLNGFEVKVGGTETTPPPVGGYNLVNASGGGPNFDLSTVSLATTGDITVNLRGGNYSANNPQAADAIIINGTNNSIINTLTLNTVDPDLQFNSQDYNLINTAAIALQPAQKLTINAAKGTNFTPGIVNPNSSPFDSSALNGGNGSNVTLTNIGPNNQFLDWVSIRDPYNATLETGPDLTLQYVNTYGDLQITSQAGGVSNGADSQTVRAAGTNLRLNAQGNITVSQAISNLTVLGALNGNVSYTSTSGTVQGSALTQATNIKVSAVGGGIGTGAQDLQLNAGTNVAFTAQSNVFLELGGGATSIGGDSTAGAIDIANSVVGNIIIDSVVVDGLVRSGLASSGVNGIKVATPFGGTLLVHQGVTATNGPIQLAATGAIIHSADGDLTTTGTGTISVNASAGNLTMVNGTVYTTAGGIATLSSSNSVQLAQVTTSGGNIFVTATTGNIARVVGPTSNLIGGNGYCSAAIGIGTLGTPILSTLSQFQGRVTGTGDIYLSDTAGGLQLTQWNLVGNSAETNSGLIDIQTITGNLTALAPVVAGGTGTINLDANASSVILGATVTTNTGSITIMGNANVTHQVGGNVTVTSGVGGTVTETATTGNVTMDGASTITTQGGSATLTAGDSIAVSAVNAAAGNIFLTATGGNISRVAGPVVNLIGEKGYAIAQTGIGASGNILQSTLSEFQADVTGTGDVYLFDTAGGLQLTDWNIVGNSVQTNDGVIDIQNGAGTLTVVDPVIAGGTGTINLNANGADVVLSQSVSTNTGGITITGSTNITHQAAGNVSVTSGAGGTVTETATTGNVTMDGASLISTQGGAATLSAGNSIAVSQVNASTGDIFLNATSGNISRVAGPVVNLIGSKGYALASSGIGASGNILQSTVSQFQGRVTGTGDIYLSDTAGGLQLTNWNGGANSAQTNSGNIDIQTANGNLTVTSPVVAGNAGTINLDANTGAVALNQTVTSNTGSISVMGNTGITHGVNGTVTVSSGVAGTVSETATSGNISMNGAAKIITQGGNITLFADNDLNVAEVNTGTSGMITATATNGKIADTTTTLFLPNFVSNEVILQANTGIGSGVPSPGSSTDIATVTNFLTASTVTGDIVISEASGITLRNISTQNGGHFYLEAGGLVNQDGASSLQIDGNLNVVTSRATTLGTVHLVNSVNTDLGASEIAGNYTVDVTGTLSLSGDQYVGLDCDFNTTNPPVIDNGNTVFHGGYYYINGVDPDLQGPMINATGPTPNFDLDLAMPFSGDPTITVNLRGDVDVFNITPIPDAIILTQAANQIHGTIDIETVDPMYQGTATNDYNLVQTSIPFTLNPGQTLIINAARGTSNPGVSGANNSPYSGSTLNGGLGSNITLPLANTANGTISIRDPNLCILNANGNPAFAHVNTYNNLTITAPTGSITAGVGGNIVRSSGSLLSFAADQSIALNGNVSALTTGGVSNGEIVYNAANGSITGTGVSQGVGVSFIAPLGGVTAQTQATNCIFTAMTGTDITNNLVGGNFGGTVTGPLTITQAGSGNLMVNSVTVNGVTRIGLTAVNQTVNLTNGAGAITQVAGNVDAGTTGTVNFIAMTGINGIGPNATFQTLSRDVLATNLTSGDIRIENRLNGSNALSSAVTLHNGPGNVVNNRNLYFSQVGGSSVDFQTVNANGTGTLLAISGSANMNFFGNVNMGDSVIAVANHNMEVGAILFNLNTPNAVATLILDQESPTLPGSGTFTNGGNFNISSNKLAIYAASGPQEPPSAIFIPPNQVSLGSLAPLATWDIGEPNGLDTKYATSYSSGGPYHGPGFGTNYTPGNGVFGSQVIWYKFDVDYPPPSPGGGGAAGPVPFDPRLGINAWEVEYFLEYWNQNLNRLGYEDAPLMLVETSFETEPLIYRPYRSAIDKLRNEVSSE
ncbi:filamentous hemagglutinin N-terminal domain-containing protein [Simkania negevensis]|uniref:Filamentous haemagglutinin FhaB/tRNA nuclease CdiA-like TPS domain-containing protein n=1 Tax=Simkania negevensis (strain ATCC VR-1471 / DSM 27360 / Z) TaxID=331113 RepID=F8L3U6_SIMNZ|nr:filamentous hemagglutinin N-terminal domain-containing protein [Simkania negevensis]CCB89971.1 hypothetical protein SNE_A20940 [Simkania negevensis Z]